MSKAIESSIASSGDHKRAQSASQTTPVKLKRKEYGKLDTALATNEQIESA